MEFGVAFVLTTVGRFGIVTYRWPQEARRHAQKIVNFPSGSIIIQST
jgi:hypothetical protein